MFDFTNHYGGVPQNLLFNLIGYFVLMLLFAVLRRAAGNYGRWALVRKSDADSEAKWTQLFFAPDDMNVEAAEAHVEDHGNLEGPLTQHDLSSIDYSAEEAMEDR